MSRKLIEQLINGPEGFAVEIFGLAIARLEDGDYTVIYERESYHSDFDNVDMALDKFFELREKNQIGFDFETCG